MTTTVHPSNSRKAPGTSFTDLGLDAADELFARERLGFQVYRILKDKTLRQGKIASLLGICRTEVSDLMNCRFHRFSIDALLASLKRLGLKVTIRIAPRE